MIQRPKPQLQERFYCATLPSNCDCGRERSKLDPVYDECMLSGTSADERTTISAEHVIVAGHGHNDGRHWIKVRALASTVTVARENGTVEPFLQLWFRSFVSFRDKEIGF